MEDKYKNTENTESMENTEDTSHVRMDMPITDIHYCCFRKELISEYERHRANPEEDSRSCGIIILAKEIGNNQLRTTSSSFGSFTDIVTTLTFTLLEKIEEKTESDDERKKAVLSDFVRYFKDSVKEKFYGDEDSPDAAYIDDI